MAECRRLFCLLALMPLFACSVMRLPERPPEIALAGLRLQSATPQRQVFVVALELRNPNPVPLRLAAAAARLDLEGLMLGRGELLEALVLPPEGTGRAELRIETDLGRHAPQLLQWVLDGRRRLNYRLRGYVDPLAAGIGRQPVDERGTVSLADLNRWWQGAPAGDRL